MQDFDWDDLKYFLALHRAGTLSAAGQRLGVRDTTVARRIRRMETRLGRMFERSGDGRYRVTSAGDVALRHAEAMEREGRALGAALEGADGVLSGTVAISAVPILTNRVLVPALVGLRAAHPGLLIELVPEGRNVDLSKREADLALRFSRPSAGGLKVKARKLGSVGFAVFGPLEGKAELPWVTYADAVPSLPQARWLAGQKGDVAQVRVSDADTALEAVAAGLGKSLLPARIGRTDGRLQEMQVAGALPARDVWLLSHEDQNHRAEVIVVKEWLAGIDW